MDVDAGHPGRAAARSHLHDRDEVDESHSGRHRPRGFSNTLLGEAIAKVRARDALEVRELSSCRDTPTHLTFFCGPFPGRRRARKTARVDVSAREPVGTWPTGTDVETALAAALTRAAEAGRWDVVGQLARESRHADWRWPTTSCG